MTDPSGKKGLVTLRGDDTGICDSCGSEDGERWQRFTDGAWVCQQCLKAWHGDHMKRPAYMPCSECGVRWGYHRGVPCTVAEERERALDHAD